MNAVSEIDTTIIEIGANEMIALATIDIEALRNNRSISYNGNAFRKPRVYGKLLDDKVDEPFVRKYARK